MKTIEIIILRVVDDQLKEGKKVPGQVYKDPETGILVFEPFGKSKRKKAVLVKSLRGGWVKESRNNIIVHDAFPKKLGLHGVINAMESDIEEVKKALENREIVNCV